MEPFDLFNTAPSRSMRDRVAQHARALLVWIGARRILVAVSVAVAAALGGWWLLHAPEPAVERGLPYASGPAVASGATPPTTEALVPASSAPTAGSVVVHVAGAVRLPGLVELPAGERVDDAVRAAGGALSDADLDALNLAAVLADGQRVYVPRVGEVVTGAVAPDASGPALRINLNTASAEDFDTLPGVGPSLARAVVAYRSVHGPFRRVEDLLSVPGIGRSKLAQFQPLVTV